MSETISDRELAARRFAEAMGWTYIPPKEGDRYSYFDTEPGGEGEVIEFPWSDDTLPEQLAFVGQLAEVVIPTITSTSRLIQQDFVEGVLRRCKADTDLTHAALLAALSALGARSGK